MASLPNDGSESMRAESNLISHTYFDNTSDDDDLSPEDHEEYCRQIEESEGFDIGPFSRYLDGHLRPYTINDYRRSYLIPYAKKAIEMFNNEQKRNFEFVSLVHVTKKSIAGIDFFITFEAKEATEDAPRTFQALVVTYAAGDMEDDFVFCRLKPTKKPGEPGRTEPTVAELCRQRGINITLCC